jgi:glycosyltransferase involved in cell wall biosynthesis
MKPSVQPLRVAVACSGLGHVQRGIEAWASDLARGLRQAGVEASLFGGAPGPDIVAMPCLRRTGRGATGLARLLRNVGGWRYGFGSPYEVEQTTFSASLWRHIWRGYDILHVQDPTIALWFERAWRHGLSRVRVIYANGTGEGADFMHRFAHLQLLTEAARETWLPAKPASQAVFTIPNFIDVQRFTPGSREQARAAFGLPRDGLIVLCCAAIRRYHKRIDYLLDEFAAAVATLGPDAVLVIAGGRENDTAELIEAGNRLLGPQVRFLPNLPRDRMPTLYQAADVFTLTSLHEMFGIVLLEAMATGLPVLCHDAPDFHAVVGPGGLYQDLSRDGGLAGGLAALSDPSAREALSRSARAHVEGCFSESVVIPAMISMYHAVLHEQANG